MKRSTALLTLLLLVLAPASAVVAQEFLSGTLISPTGQVQAISRIDARGTIAGSSAGKDVELPFSSLQKIEYLGSKIYRATTRQGKTYQIEKAELRTTGQNRRVVYWAFDDGGRTERQFVLGNQSFQSLFFEGAPGRLKFNPATGNYFPPDYIFDPFTGAQLQWQDPGY